MLQSQNEKIAYIKINDLKQMRPILIQMFQLIENGRNLVQEPQKAKKRNTFWKNSNADLRLQLQSQ